MKADRLAGITAALRLHGRCKGQGEGCRGAGGARRDNPKMPCGHADRPVMMWRTFVAKLATSIGFER